MFIRRALEAMCLVMFIYLVFPSCAHAYLDPGTGSYVFQLLIASIVGAAFLVKVYWKRIKGFVTGIFKGTEAESGEGEDGLEA